MNGGELRIVGVGNAPSEGLRRGVVVDLEKTVASITRAVDEAERMAGVPVRGAIAGIAGDHIRSINSRGVIAVSRKDNEIGPADVSRVGMSGVRLEAEVHIITGAVTSAKNICRAIQRAGLKVHDLVLEPLASSQAVLGRDERDLGVALL